MNKIIEYKNGNSKVSIFEDGTRIIKTEEENFNFDYPLNIDIRLSTECPFGYNEQNGKSICSFCHESAQYKGKYADYEKLLFKLRDLPRGIELAIGINQFNRGIYEFIQQANANGWICNITINQGLFKINSEFIKLAIHENTIKGIGISYRKGLPFPKFNYQNTVWQVIAGIDKIDDIKNLVKHGVKKILVLGEKDFGFNKNKVDLNSKNHIEWYRRVYELFKVFDIVSFDNLALEQLNIKRFVKDYDRFYQGEHSFYIDAVEECFKPSSRSNEKVYFNEIGLLDYFKNNIHKGG